MVLRNIGEETGENRAECSSQHIHNSRLLSNLHDAKPEGEHARQSERNLEGILDESKVESTIFWKIVVSPIANPMSAKMNAITKMLSKCNLKPYNLMLRPKNRTFSY